MGIHIVFPIHFIHKKIFYFFKKTFMEAKKEKKGGYIPRLYFVKSIDEVTPRLLLNLRNRKFKEKVLSSRELLCSKEHMHIYEKTIENLAILATLREWDEDMRGFANQTYYLLGNSHLRKIFNRKIFNILKNTPRFKEEYIEVEYK